MKMFFNIFRYDNSKRKIINKELNRKSFYIIIDNIFTANILITKKIYNKIQFNYKKKL